MLLTIHRHSWAILQLMINVVSHHFISISFKNTLLPSFIIVIFFILSHQSISASPLHASQNWWHSPPPAESLSHEFEIIKPRLLSIYDKIDLNLPKLQPHHHSNPSSTPAGIHLEESHPSSYLLTFYTRDQTPFYAIIYPQETSTSTSTYNPYNDQENQIDDLLGCQFYHGHLVTPSKGHLAVTTCPNEDNKLTMSATIMLSTGQVLLIRPPQSAPTQSQDTNTYKDIDIEKEYYQRGSNENKKTKDQIKDNCYMVEYEKRQVSIEDLEEMNPMKNKTEDETQFENLEEKHKLVHQFDRHYLYRLSNKSPSIDKHSDKLNGDRKHSANYSQCTEKYIINQSAQEVEDDSETTTSTEIETEDLLLDLPSEHRIVRRDLSKQDVYSKTFTIETIIFVDASLIARFNGDRKDLQKLILAIMNEVQLIYNFDSLKIRIRILIKQIVYLEDKDAPNSAEGDIDQYLDNFCAWQKRLWLRVNRTARWDHALMLTGLDLYKKVGFKKNRKVLGLAWVNGMCRPAYSCTLNEGKNFEASFVIAHEMAHSLGMLHDGYDNNCDPEKYIMSEKTGPGKINWSPCSNLYLENFLTKSNMRCLESTRSDQIKRFSDPFDQETDTRLPGEQYTLNQQCQLALGNGYKAYTSNKAPFQDVCRELWCSSGTWATPAHPALEGSTCGRRRSCYQGSCVDKQKAFAQSKIKMYNNRRPTSKPSRVPSSDDDFDRVSGNSSANSGSSHGPSFMRRVQRFLKSTIGSVVRFFG